jgi:transcriptional regulator with XRE-family HTH domain
MIIGDRVRVIRESKNLSQTELGSRAGVTNILICRIENGHTLPPVPVLERLAETLEVPLCELFYDSSNPPAWFRNLTVTNGIEDENRRELQKRQGPLGRIRARLLKPN